MCGVGEVVLGLEYCLRFDYRSSTPPPNPTDTRALGPGGTNPSLSHTSLRYQMGSALPSSKLVLCVTRACGLPSILQEMCITATGWRGCAMPHSTAWREREW